MKMIVTADDSFEDMLNSFMIGTPLFNVMADRLLAKDADHRPEYDAVCQTLRDDCIALKERAKNTDIGPVLARMDEVLEMIRNPQATLTSSQLRSLTKKIDAEVESMRDTGEDLLNSIRYLCHQQEAEKAMAQRGLSFPIDDTPLLNMLSDAATAFWERLKPLQPLNDKFQSETGKIITALLSQEWRDAFKYMAEGDAASPGLSAPPRAQFRKKTPAP